MNVFLKILRYGLYLLFFLGLSLGLAAAGAVYYLEPKLPPTETIKDIKLQVPLRVFTADGKLIGEFGEMKRAPIRYAEVPNLMIKAVLAAEDDRFFDHPGVDYQGILRAMLNLLVTGEKSQGGSTITMQVARNFFLTNEKSFLRKVNEVLLALKIDRELSKKEILELYLNKIYLGNRAYGIAAAAQVYYGKSLEKLTLAETAMLAGLPKAPSKFNPIINPDRAVIRRNYVLERMRQLNFISPQDHRAATEAKDTALLSGLPFEGEALFAAEMARQAAIDRFGENAYVSGLRITTTLDSQLQSAAIHALRKGILSYDWRHGYRGPESHMDLNNTSATDALAKLPRSQAIMGGLQIAVVTAVAEKSVSALLPNGEAIDISWKGLSWAAPYLSANSRGPMPRKAADVVKVGDVIRAHLQYDNTWHLAQLPTVEGAFVAINPKDGAIVALVGGFDFFRSNFNRVTQAYRQPGSSFKPFVYSAALDKGFTPASIVNDAPVVFDDPSLEGVWRPENYSGEFYGPTRLREALAASRNLVSIRLLEMIGLDYAVEFAAKFGFRKDLLPANLSLALGSATVTPLELSRGHAAFANGGYLIDPHIIARIEDINGQVLLQAEPVKACDTCEVADVGAETTTTLATNEPTTVALAPSPPPPGTAPRIISPQNAYLMTSMMSDVIRRGTARKALQLNRQDLAGKTGTTNDHRDAWFVGFNSNVLAVSWLGFDDPQPLGSQETGGEGALPIWMDFMAVALKGMPESTMARPRGLVSARIDPATGLLADTNLPNAIYETFQAEYAPKQYADSPMVSPNGEQSISVPEQLF